LRTSPLGVPADLQSASSENANIVWRYEKPTAGDYKSAGTPSGLALLITPSGLASLYYGLMAHPLFLLLENIGYVGGKERICW